MDILFFSVKPDVLHPVRLAGVGGIRTNDLDPGCTRQHVPVSNSFTYRIEFVECNPAAYSDNLRILSLPASLSALLTSISCTAGQKEQYSTTVYLTSPCIPFSGTAIRAAVTGCAWPDFVRRPCGCDAILVLWIRLKNFVESDKAAISWDGPSAVQFNLFAAAFLSVAFYG